MTRRIYYRVSRGYKFLNKRCSGEESKAVKEGTNVKLVTDRGESDADSPISIDAMPAMEPQAQIIIQ